MTGLASVDGDDVEQVEVDLIYKPGQSYHLTPLFDLHLDADDSDADALAALIKERNKLPNHSYICGGDIGDWIVPTDLKRYRASNARLSLAQCDDFVDQALEYQVSVLSKCNKIDMLVDGNHEQTILGRHHVDVVAELASRLPGKPQLGGMSGFLRYNLRWNTTGNGLKSFVAAYHHGFSAGQAAISPATVRWFTESLEGWDVGLFGHNHKSGEYQFSTMRPAKSGPPVARDRRLVACGTFLRNYQSDRHAGYGEIRGDAVTHIGAPLIRWTYMHLAGGRDSSRARREEGHAGAWIKVEVVS